MKLTRREQSRLFVETTAAAVSALARKYYAKPHVLARLAQDIGEAQVSQAKLRASIQARARK